MPVKSNYQEWKRRWTAIEKASKESIRSATPGVAKEVRDLIRERIPPGNSSRQGMTNAFPGYAARGTLKSAIVAGPVRDQGKSFVAKVGLGASVGAKTRMIARVHEYGMVIKARNKPYMRFQIGGQWVSIKRVRIRSKRFFRAGMDEAQQRFPEFVGKYIKGRFPRKG